MGFACRTFILAVALPTLINTQCLPDPSTTTTTIAPITSSTTTTTPHAPQNPDLPAASPQDRTTECPPNNCWRGGCEINSYTCQTVCQTTCDCKCPDDSAEPDCEACHGVESTFGQMDAKKCEELCIASRDAGGDNPCRFWRYDRESLNAVEFKTCTFLSSEQCLHYQDCSGSCKCGDVGCPGDGEDPEEGPKACQAPIEYHPGSLWIHWTCFNVEHPDMGSPYNELTTLYADTLCTTTHKCVDWDGEGDAEMSERKLTVRCNGNTAEDSGHWEPVNPVDGDKYYGENGVIEADGVGVIKEHQCLPDESASLEVTILDMGIGAQLSCENPDTDSNPLTYTITPPNKCVLLCDFHLAMVIEGRLNDDGDFNFYQLDTDGTADVVIDDAAKIKCW